MIVCPECKSGAIVEQNAYRNCSINPAYAVNAKAEYSKEDWRCLELGHLARDVRKLICLSCEHSW